jgi:hypothetical protein
MFATGFARRLTAMSTTSRLRHTTPRATVLVEALEERNLLSHASPTLVPMAHLHALGHAQVNPVAAPNAPIHALASKHPHTRHHPVHVTPAQANLLRHPAKPPKHGVRATAGGPVPVVVTNTPTNPVYTVDARTPFAQGANVDVVDGFFGDTSFVVPASGVLTIENFTMGTDEIPISSSYAPREVNILATYKGTQYEYDFGNFTSGPPALGDRFFNMNDSALIFADPGSTVTISVEVTTNTGGHTFFFTLTGYLQPST